MLSVMQIYCLLSMISLGFADNATEIPGFPGLLPDIKANIEDYPFMVHLTVEIDKVELQDLIKFLMCVGSLVQSTWVMTSAGCLNTNFLFPELKPVIISKDKVELRVKLDKATPTEVLAQTAVKAANVLMHPEFAVDKIKKIHNFGLVKLMNPFELIPKTGLVHVPDNNVEIDGNVTIVGYNQYNRNIVTVQNDTHHTEGEETDLSFKKVSTKVWPKDECLTKSHDNPATICIGEPGNLPWVFDNGGPLLYEHKIVGIALGSGDPTEYGIYEDVYAHIDWINFHLKLNDTGTGGFGVQLAGSMSIIYLNIAVVYIIKSV